MNSNVYVFGRLGSGYTQYPNDYTNFIFDELSSRASGPSQMAIHRDGDIMYYAYIRKLDKDQQYIGFCVVLNGVNFSFPVKLFGIFENAVADLVARGEILMFEENGDISSKVSDLNEKPLEVEYIATIIRGAVSGLSGGTYKLPPEDYSVAKTESRLFSVNDSDEDISKAVCRYPYVLIQKDKNLNTSTLNGYKGVISRLHKEKQELIVQHKELQEEFNKLQKQKKQFQLVVLLAIVVLGCVIGLSLMIRNLSSTEHELSYAHETIDTQKEELINASKQISALNENITNARDSLKHEINYRRDIESDLRNIEEIIASTQPIIVKNTSFDWDSGYLTFEYYGFEETDVTLQVRVYRSGVNVSNSIEMTTRKGINSCTIYASAYLDRKEWHYFELLINNKIVGGGRH